MLRTTRNLLVATSTCFALIAAASSTAQATTLTGTVGPGYVISLTTASGQPVRSVVAGRTYTIVVRDRAHNHNFRLAGPGFARQTGIRFVGTVRWTVRFRAGTWTYLCQPHSLSMQHTFRAV